jgi:hypothetical protein
MVLVHNFDNIPYYLLFHNTFHLERVARIVEDEYPLVVPALEDNILLLYYCLAWWEAKKVTVEAYDVD